MLNLCSIELFWVFSFGILITLILLYKKLRIIKVYWLVFSFTVLIALIGFINLDKTCLQMKNGHAATTLFSPLLFMILFGVLRKVFISIFNHEPLMSQPYAFSFDQGEYRKLHYGDVIFTIACFLLPIILPGLIYNL